MYETYCKQCRSLGLTLEEAIEESKHVFKTVPPWYVIAIWWKLT